MVPMPTATSVPADDLISVQDAVMAAAAGERSVKEGDGLFTLKNSTSIGMSCTDHFPLSFRTIRSLM